MSRLKDAESIGFTADITNEEALLLQQLHEKKDKRLVCPEAEAYQYFLNTYASTSGKQLFVGNLSDVLHSEVVITFGVWLEETRSEYTRELSAMLRQKNPYVVYMHPIEDGVLGGEIQQFIKYEVGSEEGVAALLVDMFLKEKILPLEVTKSLQALDVGYLSAESNVGEEELDEIRENLAENSNILLILGSDLYTHPKATEIAQWFGLLERFTQVSVVCLPPARNALGVALLCSLSPSNEDADVFYESCKEGTYVNADKEVCTNAQSNLHALEQLNTLGVLTGYLAKEISDITTLLPQEKGFRQMGCEKADLHCLYTLTIHEQISSNCLDEIDDLPVFDGATIYTYLIEEAEADGDVLRGSKQFALASKLHDGAYISFRVGDTEMRRVFKIDTHLKGVIALNPIFDIKLSPSLLSSYRFSRLAFENTNNQKIGNNNE